MHTDTVCVCVFVCLSVFWSEDLQVDRPKGMTLADGVLAPHMLAICHAKYRLIWH